MVCNTSLFDKEMFKTVWKPVVSAIAYAFITFDDDWVIERAISGFRQCATLARHFHLPDVFDYVVVSLSQATALLPENLPSQVPNYPVVEVEGQSITVSSLSVKFGTNFKGQLAAVVLFNIVNGNGNSLREGWTQVGTKGSDLVTSLIRHFRSSKCSRISSCIRYYPYVCSRWRTSWEEFQLSLSVEVSLHDSHRDPTDYSLLCHLTS